ncbi:Riboflavin transporter MCH5 [Colletotrichum fructicola]|nr:Riboflavin transporter MCH5 [Colletotrichum fructicola]KAF4939463.1 Riboflavin transporter MCH5 [Colletotrichum fructicola]KAF5503196.1 Riboflavin transporter MCH5 [Colletotrichum fructicola]
MSSPSAQNNSDLGMPREATSTNFELESGQQAPPSDAPSLRNTRSADIENRISSWVCVLGAFIFLLPSYGFPQAIGTVQAYLQEHQLSGYSARDIGWVTGLYTALTLFLGIQAGPIVDRYGTEVLAPLSTALTLPTFFLLAECKYYWQFMLCLGIYGGIGGALASTVAVSVVGKIFTRLRGLAIGLALTGSALGGVIFPFLLRELFPKWGWAWSMRFVGFTIAGVMIPGTLCFIPFAKLSRTHHHTQLVVPSQPSADPAAPTPRHRAASATINFAAFRVPAFSLIAAAFFLLEFVIFGISGIFPTLANWAGYPADTGYNIVAIVNGCGCISRIGAGFLGDKLGHYNVLFTSTCVTIVCVAVTILPFGTTHIQALYVFAVLWGLSSGVFSALIPACMGKTCQTKDYGRCFGSMNFTVSFALLITVPIGGQILESIGGMALAGLYVGVLCMAGGCILASRSLLVQSWLDYKVRI